MLVVTGCPAYAGHDESRLTSLPHPAAAQQDHLRARRHALVEVDHVLIDHADAAGGDAAADGPRLGGAVDAVERVLVVLPQIKRAGAERVARSTRHAEAPLQF